jgi:starch synthase
MLSTNYSINNFEKGKQENKAKLCDLFNLDPTKPLFSFIGRLEEKVAIYSKASALAFFFRKFSTD